MSWNEPISSNHRATVATGLSVLPKIVATLFLFSLGTTFAFGQSAKTPTNATSKEDANAYRQFTDSQGRKIEARLLSIAEGNAKIELKEGKRVISWPVQNFSADDQSYMRDWAKENISYRFVVRSRVLQERPRPPVKGQHYHMNMGASTNNSDANHEGGNRGFNDDDSEAQFLSISVSNTSSAQLSDLEVAVWVILSRNEARKGSKNTQRFVPISAMLSFPDVKVGEQLSMIGNYSVAKVRLRDREYTKIVREDSPGRFTELGTISQDKFLGSVRETVAGVMVRIYHNGALVDEVTDFGGLLKSSDFDTNFPKPKKAITAVKDPFLNVR